MTFIESSTCQSGMACFACRMQESFRNQIAVIWPETPREFVCPRGLALNQPPDQIIPVNDVRRRLSVTRAKTLLQAILTSERVSLEEQWMRMTICSACIALATPQDGSPPFCGLCCCGVTTETRRIVNLTAYKENLPKWGCKLPGRGGRRADGSPIGWPLPVTVSEVNTPEKE